MSMQPTVGSWIFQPAFACAPPARRLRCYIAGIAVALALCLTACHSNDSNSTMAEDTVPATAGPVPAAPRPVVIDYGSLPLSFELNEGQSDQPVRFLARGRGYTVLLTPQEAALVLPAAAAERPESPPRRGHTHIRSLIRLQFAGAQSPSAIVGNSLLSAKSNYFIGNDPKQWRRNIPNYREVRYRDLYPGVDAVFHGAGRQLEYDFIVRPGADPRGIALQVQGADRLQLNHDGDVVLRVSGSQHGDAVLLKRPAVFEDGQRGRHRVDADLVIRDRNIVAFKLGPYNPANTLIIDPTVDYSTYLGGNGGTGNANAIAVDGSGYAYVTGWVGATGSMAFPTTIGSYNPGPISSKSEPAFVTKMKTDGSGLVYSTYFGGFSSTSSITISYAIAVDSSGAAYFGGYSYSPDLPTTPGSFMPVRPINPTNSSQTYGGPLPFVAKLSADGSALVYSTYLDGYPANVPDSVSGIAVDLSGNAYISGNTTAANFPTTAGAFQTQYQGALVGSAFVAKLSADGSSLVYSTFLGGVGDGGEGYNYGDGAITVDSSGSAYVTGITDSAAFPTTQGAYSTTCASSPCQSAFVTKLNTTGSGLVYSTFLGGNKEDSGRSIAVDSSGAAYIGGVTTSTTFPVTPGAIQSSPGAGFVSKLNANGQALEYSSYFSGIVESIAVGSDDSAVIFGLANTAYSFDSTAGAFTIPPCATTSCSFAFIAKLTAAGSGLVFSSPFGGDQECCIVAGTVDTAGNAYIAGTTAAQDLPTTEGSYQPSDPSSSGFTPFVAKIALGVANSPASIVAVSGSGQSSIQGTAFSNPLVVLVSDANGNPLSGVTVAFSGGSLSFSAGAVATTNTSGNAQITATPSAAGSLTATATVSGLAQTASFSLTGQSVPAPVAILSPSSLSFGKQVSSSTSAASSVTLSNMGNAVLDITGTGIGISGANAGDFQQTNQCGTSVAAGDSCTVSVTFTPGLSAGAETATLNVTDNASGSPQQVQLSGIAALPPSVSCNIPAITLSADSASVTVSCTVIDFVGTIDLNCNLPASLSAYVTCNFDPASLVFTSSVTQASTTLNIQPVLTSAVLRNGSPRWPAGAFASLAVGFWLPAWAFALRGKKIRPTPRTFLLVLVLVGCLQILAACHSGSSNNASTTAPPGTYATTVVLTGAGLSSTTITFDITVP